MLVAGWELMDSFGFHFSDLLTPFGGVSFTQPVFVLAAPIMETTAGAILGLVFGVLQLEV